MVYSYQKNSYLKEISSKVISCLPGENGKFEITLEDTVLFPEGGGQPDDKGMGLEASVKWANKFHELQAICLQINEALIEKVTRKGAVTIHHSTTQLEEGSSVCCSVDWKRRFDHMQQHSAQHLLSALADKTYGFKTTSWDLGKSISHVELTTPKITQAQIDELERDANEQIRKHRPVIIHLLSKEESQDIEEVRSRGLPDDHEGPVRIIEIDGVEKNMCCGTHVNNLSELQAIKLLHTESMRGGTRLMFIAGNRILEKVNFCFNNERKLTKLLSCGPEEHASAIEKSMKNSRSIAKTSKSYLKEIAQFEASLDKKEAVENGYICHHREDGDSDYINTFLNEFKDEKNVLICISVGEIKNGGQFVLIGTEAQLNAINTSVCDALQAKGGGKKGRFQGKAKTYQKLNDVHTMIKNNAKEH